MFYTNDWGYKAITLTPQEVNDSQALKEPELYKIQLIEGKTSYIYFTNIHDACLPEAFKWVTGEVGEDNTIALDLEWHPDSRGTKNKACLFQIGTCSRVLVIRYIGENCEDGELLKNFLVSHKFIGKGIFFDLKKLYERFNVSFNNILDMERAYLRPNHIPYGFAKMCDALGVKATAEYKNKKVSVSNWDASDLSKQQVLYSAFDVVGLYYSFTAAKASFPETNVDYTKPQKKYVPNMERKQKKEKRQKKKKGQNKNKPREKSLISVIRKNTELKEENKRLKLMLHIIKQSSKKEE